MAKTSAKVKNRYNAKKYDRIGLVVPKGEKEKITAHAAAKGETVNGLIVSLIKKEMEPPG